MMERPVNVIFILIIGLLILVACGGNSGSGSDASTLQAGQYRAILKNINGNVAGNNTYGTAVINFSGEEMEVKLNVADSHANVSHLQQIYSGGNCPGMEADANADGVVDAMEGERFYGNAVMALDKDLTSQDPVGSTYPRANGAGNYSYSTKANLPAVKESLAGSSFGLSGRSFVIHGVRAGSIPATAAAQGELSAEASLPIACGMIVPIPSEN